MLFFCYDYCVDFFSEDIVSSLVLYDATPNNLNSSHIYPPIQILKRKHHKLFFTTLDMVSYSMRSGEANQYGTPRRQEEGPSINDYTLPNECVDA
ncbi:MAG: hypothetical protein QXN79_04015 [Zestosphaera sp.]